MTPRFIYKLVTDDEHRFPDFARGSADDQRDGFIHFSTAEQVQGTFEKYFAGRPRVSLLRAETATLGDQLRWEPSRGGALFPHYYGELGAGVVLTKVASLPPSPEGGSILPRSWFRGDGPIDAGLAPLDKP